MPSFSVNPRGFFGIAWTFSGPPAVSPRLFERRHYAHQRTGQRSIILSTAFEPIASGSECSMPQASVCLHHAPVHQCLPALFAVHLWRDTMRSGHVRHEPCAENTLAVRCPSFNSPHTDATALASPPAAWPGPAVALSDVVQGDCCASTAVDLPSRVSRKPLSPPPSMLCLSRSTLPGA